MNKRICVLLVVVFCAAIAGAGLSSVGSGSKQAQAGELQPEFPHAIMIEEKLCTALVIALGHQGATTAALRCLNLKTPSALQAVAGFMKMSDGVDDPIFEADPLNPCCPIRIDQECVADTNENDKLCDAGDEGVDDEIEVMSQIDSRDDGVIDGQYKLYASDFATIDLDGSQLHQADGALWVLVFSDNDNPARFRPTVGAMRVDTAQPGSYDFTCGSFLVDNVSSFDEDCDGDGEIGDGVKPAELFPGPTAIDRGDGVMRITEPHRETYLDYTVVGELASISFTLLKTTAEAGTPDNECSFPLSVSGVTEALANQHLAIVLVHGEDTDGTQIASTLLDWTIEPIDEPNFDQPGDEILETAFPFLPTTPTVDLGSFGKGFPQAICGGDQGPAKVHVVVRTSSQAASLDPGARDVQGSFDVTIIGEPHEITEVTSTPAVATCDGTSTVELSARVIDEAGNNVVNNNLVRFDTQVLGTANPISAKTVDGIAKTTITPLANSSTGVPVTIFTDNDKVASFLIQCGPGSGDDAVGAAPGGGAAEGAGGPRGTISGPDTGSAGMPAGGALSWWPALALGLAAMGLGAVRWSFNKR